MTSEISDEELADLRLCMTADGFIPVPSRRELAALIARLDRAESELAKYRENPLWNIRAAPEPPWCDTCQEYTDHETSGHATSGHAAAYDRALSPEREA